MHIEEIVIDSWSHPRFHEFWDIYNHAFPREEKRSLEDQRKVMQCEKYTIKVWTTPAALLGCIAFWEYDDFFYVEHYAIHPDFRCRGYGRRFLQSWLEQTDKPIILEIEPVMDQCTRRRVRFYTSLSFHENSINHVQPPYHADLDPLPLTILSFPEKLPSALYRAFSQKQQKEIIPPSAPNHPS